jgi:hypothetical protein
VAKSNATKPDDTASKLTDQERVIPFCAATGIGACQDSDRRCRRSDQHATPVKPSRGGAFNAFGAWPAAATHSEMIDDLVARLETFEKSVVALASVKEVLGTESISYKSKALLEHHLDHTSFFHCSSS